MIDIHSHILYEVDDGSKSIEESINILSFLSKIGYTDVILTPHYIEYSSYNKNKFDNEKKLKLLKNKLKENNVNINIYLGNEIYINNNILNLVKNSEISTLNNSKYLLIELPMNGKYDNYIEIFRELIENGYIVILAHPERYISFQKDFSLILELKEMGILFQCNIESILKKYGRGAYKLIKKLSKEKLINFLASDIHHIKDDYLYIDKAKKLFSKYYSYDELEEILSINQKDIIGI